VIFKPKKLLFRRAGSPPAHGPTPLHEIASFGLNQNFFLPMPEAPAAPPPPSSRRSTRVDPKDRIPVGQKIAYGMGSANDMWGNWLYPTMVWPVFNMFLHVSPLLVSLALMINRLVDAASDPFFGWVSDNTRTRFGRRRPYILVGSLLAGVTMPILLFVSPSWSEGWLFVYMIFSSALFITIVSCFNMPYQSLGNELTPDYTERTNLFAYKGCIQKVAEVAFFSFALFATSTVWIGATFADAPERVGQLLSLFGDWFGDASAALFAADTTRIAEAAKNPFYWNTGAEGEPNVLVGGQVFVTGIGLLMMVVGVIVFFSVKERYYAKIVETNQGRISLPETIYKTLRCRPFRVQLAMALSYGLATSMLGALGYYLTVYHVCGGNITMGSAWNFGMGLSGMLCGLLGVPTFAFIAKLTGKRRAMMAVQLSAISVFIASWWLYNPALPWLQLLASGGIAFTQGGFWALYGAIGADVIDYDELETGKRREGAFAATGTYIMKVGLAIGIFLSGVILSATGFDAALGGEQDPAALVKMRLAFAAIPLAGLVLAFFMLLRFPLNRATVESIRAQLEARRGTV
jgi:glycoside/pentoside/hexuronide:cation symporter, GPH family